MPKKKNPRLTREEIDACFEGQTSQTDVLLALHRRVIPNFDGATKVDGYVQCNRAMWVYIAEKFMAFDREHHPNIMAGGAWLNWGFSTADARGLPDDEIILPPIVYQRGAA